MTGFDVTDLLHKAKQHSNRVGIIAFNSVIEGVQRIAPILGIEQTAQDFHAGAFPLSGIWR